MSTNSSATPISSKAELWPAQSSTLAIAGLRGAIPRGVLTTSDTRTRRSALGYGVEPESNAFTTLKIAVFAATPSANEITATAVNPGALAGFTVTAHDSGNVAARTKAGIATQYGSCHTALIDGYAIEGHVPVREIQRLLKERPAAIGLAVPGMVIGSPGMEQGGRVDPYTVLLLHRDGGSSSYAKYRG